MNPYESFLLDRDPAEVIGETPDCLTAYAERLGAEGMNRSFAPGKWNTRRILCHLADCEIAFGFRLRQGLAEPHHMIQPFDQDAWAAAYSSDSLDAKSALAAFSAARRWNILLVKTITPEQFSKPLSHPERGRMNLRTVIETMAGHDLNHMAQIGRVAEAADHSVADQSV